MSAFRAFFQAYAGPIRTRINKVSYGQCTYNVRGLHIIFPLPKPNVVNSNAKRAGIGLKECLKRAHSPFSGAFHSAPFSLLSRLDYCPLSPPRHRLLPLPIPNFVNSRVNQPGIGLKEWPKCAHSQFLGAFRSAPFSLLSR